MNGINMKNYDYDTVMKCIAELGIEKTLSPEALEILLLYRDAEDDVLFSLIFLLENPFTEDAIKYMSK